MSKKLRGMVVLFMCFAFVLSLSLISEKVSAKTQAMVTGEKVEIGNYIYKFENEQFETDSLTYSIRKASIVQYSKKTGKKIKLVRQSTSSNIVTNGKVLYYSQEKGGKSIISKMDIKNKRISKIYTVDKRGYSILGGTDNYLYIGDGSTPSGFYITSADFYLFNLRTKQLKRLYDNAIGWMQVKYNKILIHAPQGGEDNIPIEILTESGKRVFEVYAASSFLAKGKLFYAKIFYYPDYRSEIKYYQCDLNGKNKKRIKEKTYKDYGKEVYGN